MRRNEKDEEKEEFIKCRQAGMMKIGELWGLDE